MLLERTQSARREVARRFLAGLFLLAGWSCLCAAEPFAYYHEAVLGTSLELRFEAEDAAASLAAEDAALAELDRLNQIFSSYDSTSEFARWQAAPAMQRVSPELAEVLRRADDWRERTGNAFHPGAQLLTEIWSAAEERQALPEPTQLRRAVERLQAAPWQWAEVPNVAAPNGYPLSLNAIAKGYILDRAAAHAAAVPGVRSVLVNLGGDMVASGDAAFPVVIRAAVDSTPQVVWLRQAALATSGNAYRFFSIQGNRHSHLLDPRSGMPVQDWHAVSVIAPNAMDADALATALSVMGAQRGRELVDQLPGVACRMVGARGEVLSSRGWQSSVGGQQHLETRLAAAPEAPTAPENWNGGMELAVDFEIQRAAGGGRYRRPYVAVWVEDQDGFPVRTLVLWVQSTGPGPRWIPDLRRWHKSDRLRRLADDTDLVETISEATKKPGTYSVVWDGTDDGKSLVKPGKYTLYVEAAREHGTYQLIRSEIQLGADPFRQELAGNEEIKSAVVDYRKRAVH